MQQRKVLGGQAHGQKENNGQSPSKSSCDGCGRDAGVSI